MQKSLLRLFSVSLFLALAISAMLPVRAFADEGTPTDPVPTEEPAVSTEEPAPSTEDTATTEPSVGEEPASDPSVIEEDLIVSAEEVVIGDGTLTEEPALATEVLNSESLLAEVLVDTEIILLNEEGEQLPLVSEEAAEIIAGSDPQWCPVGVTPNSVSCMTGYTEISALFADLVAFPKSVAGVIWIEDGYAGTLDAILDGSNPSLVTMKTFSLTLKGGWTGAGTTIDINSPSTFSHMLWIFNWEANITLSDITITGDSTAGANDLYVTTSKNINLTRVKVDNNNIGLSAATYLNNTAGGAGTGNVTITGSSFSQNTGTAGLSVVSNGVITLSNVMVNNTTGGGGALLVNSSAPFAKNVILSGTNDFNDNENVGLSIESKGLVTLNNVSASGNGTGGSGDGADIVNTASTTAQGVTLTGTNLFNENYGYGLYVESKGAVKLSTVITNSNLNSSGMYIKNTFASTGLPVTLTGSGQFKYNGGSGAEINSNGAVTLNNITANNNGNMGASIDNNDLFLAAAVTLTGTNTFNLNDTDGLNIVSSGAILLSNVTARDNGQGGSFGSGASLDNTSTLSAQKVTLSGVNNFNLNFGNGLGVLSKGAISVNSVTADSNGANGVVLENYTATTPQAVTLTGTNTINDNFDYGLDVDSKGVIKLNSVTANENGIDAFTGYGADLNNNYGGALGGVTLSGANQFNGNYDGGLLITSKGAILMNNITAANNVAGAGVYIDNTPSTSTTPQNVILTGTNIFSNNDADGLTISSYGAVSLANITANDNGAKGLSASNNGGTIAKGVTLSGVNSFDNNNTNGISISSIGPIKLNSTSVTDTIAGDGSSLYNASGAAQSVILTGTNKFSGSYGNGLNIQSVGAVSLNSVTASNNGTGAGGGWGVYINNSTLLSPQKVTLTGTNLFDGNKNTGLFIQSKGAVSLQNITATNTIADLGVYIDNACCVTTNAQPVTLGGTNVLSNNSQEGLSISSYGAITLNNVTASGNDSYGADLYNAGSAAATPPKIALTGTNVFSDNLQTGLRIQTRGAITSTFKLTASGNQNIADNAAGVSIDNTISGSIQPVTLLGTNIFIGNEGDGLNILTNGAITINSVTANQNGTSGAGEGADLNNYNLSVFQNVKLTGTNTFIGNQSNGLTVVSAGSITLSNVTANDSVTNKGVQLTNNSIDGKGVTVSGTNTFNGNSDTGISIISKGVIAMNNITVIDNGYAGIEAQNVSASTPQAFKLTGTNWFEDNTTYGLWVISKGAISVNNVTSINNGAEVFLDNNEVDAVGGVTMTGTNYFYSTGSGAAGLRIQTLGAVSLSKITANGNTGGGLDIDSSLSVTITCGSFTNNTGRGMDITSAGLITLKGVTSSGNTVADTFNGSPTPDIYVRGC
jgi:hypothetical protein